MIEVAGKQFRTLEDDLYVNRKKVEEVWLDPVDGSGRRYLVYPEANYTYMKIAGATNVHGHQHPANDNGDYIGYLGESWPWKPLCNGLESDIEASAVMVAHTDKMFSKKGFHFMTSGGCFCGGNQIYSGKKYYSETSRSLFLTPSMGQEFNSGIYYSSGIELSSVMATIGLRIKPRKMQFCSYEFSSTDRETVTIIPASNPDTRHYAYLLEGTITPDDPELMERITQAFTISCEFTAKASSITGLDTNGKEIKRFPKRDIYSDGIRDGESRVFVRLISELEDDVTMPYSSKGHATHISVYTDHIWGYAKWVRCYVQGVTTNGTVVNGYYYIQELGFNTVHIPIPLQQLISLGHAETEDEFAIHDSDYITP